jgi:hypothetical protein
VLYFFTDCNSILHSDNEVPRGRADDSEPNKQGQAVGRSKRGLVAATVGEKARNSRRQLKEELGGMFRTYVLLLRDSDLFFL